MDNVNGKMEGPELANHTRYGLYSRHDLITLDGIRIPHGTTYVNVGQPYGVTVSRYDRGPIQIVITDAGYNAREAHIEVGDTYWVNALPLLKALDEIVGSCQCRVGDQWCPERRGQ